MMVPRDCEQDGIALAERGRDAGSKKTVLEGGIMVLPDGFEPEIQASIACSEQHGVDPLIEHGGINLTACSCTVE